MGWVRMGATHLHMVIGPIQQMATPFASKKGKKKVTNYGGLLICSARKADVLLAASLEVKMLRKKRKKMVGGEEEKIW
jgi:hypothetical protein